MSLRSTHPTSSLDSEGWAEIDALIAGAKAIGKELDLALIRDVAASSDKAP